MDSIPLGDSGMLVSRYVLGTLTFAGTNGFEPLGSIDADRGRRMVDLALEAGVNAFDTADLYSAGDAETVLGKALRGRRDDVLLFSKGRSPTSDDPNAGGASRVHLTRALEDSLRRLGTEHLDLYFVHQWDGLTPIEETVDAMSGFVRSGKIRYWGISNYSGWAVAATALLARERGFVPPVAHQIYYTPEAREAEYEIITADRQFGLASMVWSPLGQGLFGGRARARGDRPAIMPDGTRQGSDEWSEPYVPDWSRFSASLAAVESVAEETGRSVPQVTLAWLRDRPGIGPIVLGARTEEQLTDDLASADLVLSADQSERIEAAGRPAPLYPFWHRSVQGMDRPTPSEADYLRGYRETMGV